MRGRAHQAALQAGCVAAVPGVGQEADFLAGPGLQGCSARVRDLLGGVVAVQAQEAELHRAGPRVFQLGGENTGKWGCFRRLCSPQGNPCQGTAAC